MFTFLQPKLWLHFCSLDKHPLLLCVLGGTHWHDGPRVLWWDTVARRSERLMVGHSGTTVRGSYGGTQWHDGPSVLWWDTVARRSEGLMVGHSGTTVRASYGGKQWHDGPGAGLSIKRTRVRKHCRIKTWAVSFLEEMLKTVGSIYLVSVPGKVKYPTHGNVEKSQRSRSTKTHTSLQ